MQKENKDKLFWIINTCILFLYAVDIFGFPNKLAIIWIGFVGIYCWKTKIAIKIDIKTILLAAAMFSHAAIYKYYNPDFSTGLILSLGLVPVLFYLLGRQLIGIISVNNKRYEYKAEILTVVISVGMFIHALLNFYVWLQGDRGKFWDDFWPDMMCTISTRHSFLSVAIVSLIAYGLFYFTPKWYYSILLLVMAVIANGINVMYDNRMVLAITVVILGMNAVIYLYLNRKSKKTWCIALGIFVAGVLLAALVLGMNLGGIKDTQYYRNLVMRDGGIIRNIRFQIHAKAISQLLSHWKGGATMELLGFSVAHNYWLDLANQTGLASFIPMVLFTVSGLVDMIKLILNENISNKLKYLLPSVFMAIFSYHYMEVGGMNQPNFVLYFTFMAGIIYQVQRCAKSGQQ